MEILVGKNAGFCFGVSNAVRKAEQELETYSAINCLGELAHNKQVVAKLEQMGLRTIQDIKEAKGRTIIRAHGISKEVYQYAKQHKITLVDLTCPKVLKTHEIVEEYSNKGYYILYLGVKAHPEAIGTISFAKNASLIEREEEVDSVIDHIKRNHISNIFILAQTTYSLEKFELITNKLKKLLPECNLVIKNTICHATELRQKETEEMANNVDFMIIIGGKNSSNTRKLYDISIKYCPSILVETEQELPILELEKYNKIGIMAGASTPQESIDAVVKKIESYSLDFV